METWVFGAKFDWDVETQLFSYHSWWVDQIWSLYSDSGVDAQGYHIILLLVHCDDFWPIKYQLHAT